MAGAPTTAAIVVSHFWRGGTPQSVVRAGMLGLPLTIAIIAAYLMGVAWDVARKRGLELSAFGAAASLAVVLIWVYYSAQIFLLGAEFTWVYAHRHGSRRGRGRAGTA